MPADTSLTDLFGDGEGAGGQFGRDTATGIGTGAGGALGPVREPVVAAQGTQQPQYPARERGGRDTARTRPPLLPTRETKPDPLIPPSSPPRLPIMPLQSSASSSAMPRSGSGGLAVPERKTTRRRSSSGSQSSTRGARRANSLGCQTASTSTSTSSWNRNSASNAVYTSCILCKDLRLPSRGHLNQHLSDYHTHADLVLAILLLTEKVQLLQTCSQPVPPSRYHPPPPAPFVNRPRFSQPWHNFPRPAVPYAYGSEW